MEICFCPLASGSSGNCVYVSAGDDAVLVDAGLSGKNVRLALEEIGADASCVKAVLTTHEHSDHTQSLGVLARRYKIPVFATKGTWRALNANSYIGVIDEGLKMVVEPGRAFSVGRIEINAFNIPHDAVEPVGYTFSVNGAKIAVATDIGEPTDEIRENLLNCDALLLESNHDLEMLRNGRYPQILKRRIASPIGHLSNVSAGTLLSEVFSNRLRHVFLGHLSEENNRPLIALDTVAGILNANDIQTNGKGALKLSVAERYAASVPFKINVG